MTKILWKSVGEYKAVGDGRVDAVMSSESMDRDGDIIRQDGWDLSEFATHPVLMADHNYDLLHQIGKWSDVRVEGGALRGTATYHIGKGNPHADWAFHLAEQGEAAFSVGFIPDMDKAVEIDGKGLWGSYEFRGQKLLETSQVAIPSNPDAVQLSARAKWAKSLKDDPETPDWGTLKREVLDRLADMDGHDAIVMELRSRVGLLEANYIDDIIERLKADYPHLFQTPEVHTSLARWLPNAS